MLLTLTALGALLSPQVHATVIAAPLAVTIQEDRPTLGVTLDTSDGLRVTEVSAGSAAEVAGLRVGDVLLNAGGRELGEGDEAFDRLVEMLREAGIGGSLPMIVARDGDMLEIGVTVGDQNGAVEPPAPQAAPGTAFLGVTLGPENGPARLDSVLEDTAAQRAGLLAGDVILSVDGRETETPSALVDVLGEMRAGQRAEVIALRDGDRLRFELELGARPGTEQVARGMRDVFGGQGNIGADDLEAEVQKLLAEIEGDFDLDDLRGQLEAMGLGEDFEIAIEWDEGSWASDGAWEDGDWNEGDWDEGDWDDFEDMFAYEVDDEQLEEFEEQMEEFAEAFGERFEDMFEELEESLEEQFESLEDGLEDAFVGFGDGMQLLAEDYSMTILEELGPIVAELSQPREPMFAERGRAPEVSELVRLRAELDVVRAERDEANRRVEQMEGELRELRSEVRELIQLVRELDR